MITTDSKRNICLYLLVLSIPFPGGQGNRAIDPAGVLGQHKILSNVQLQ